MRNSNGSSPLTQLIFIGLVLIIGYYAVSHWKEWTNIPDLSSLERYEPIEAIQIFDKNDHLISTVEGDEDRRVVPLSQISTQMQQAMLAAEDHHFYEHNGVNPVSVFRAIMANLQAGHIVEGGSTITQQLVKNLFFGSGERTFSRKFKEALLSWELERRYSKEKILELYLNQVYFGNGAYGIDRAATKYFGKSAANLNLAESAFLAGLVKAPSELGVIANRQQAIARQREIIQKMVEYGYVTIKQAQDAVKQELFFVHNTGALQKYPYFISYVLQLLRERFSQAEMRRQGLRIYTTMDTIAQETAERVLTQSIEHAPKGVSQGALVSLAASDGSVVALVGGVGDFWKNQWNRATNPHTAGSSFKPFVYLTGLLQGAFTPNTIINDSPITISQGWGMPSWSPKNFDHKFLGPITMRKALTLSRNVCSVRIAQKVGIENVVETARLAGITTKLDPNLSLALGSSAVTPLDMASAYSTIARGGVAIKPRILRRIEDNRGQVIEVFEPVINKVFPADPVADLIDMMQDVVKFGTGTQARLPDRPVAGKTGTADESKDIWFIGFTPDLVTAVWGGNDENKAIPGTYVTGGTIMAKIWQRYNLAYYEKHPTSPGSFITRSAPATQPASLNDQNTNNTQLPTEGNTTENNIDQQSGAQSGNQNLKPTLPLPPVLEQLINGKSLIPETPHEDTQKEPAGAKIISLPSASAPPVAPSIAPLPVMSEPQISKFRPAPPEHSKFLPAPAPNILGTDGSP